MLEMSGEIHGFVRRELESISQGLNVLLYSVASQFCEIVTRVAVEILNHYATVSTAAVTV